MTFITSSFSLYRELFVLLFELLVAQGIDGFGKGTRLPLRFVVESSGAGTYSFSLCRRYLFFNVPVNFDKKEAA